MAQRRRMGPPSTKWYPKGERAGKIHMGRRCNPVFMKQEGTHCFGRRHKSAPAPHSGLNYNKARGARESAAADPNRMTAQQQQQYRILLSVWMQDLDERTKSIVGPTLRRRAERMAREGVDARREIARARAACNA